MKKIIGIIEQGFVVLSLIFYTSGPLPLILSGGAGQGIDDVESISTDSFILQALFFVNYLIIFLLIIFQWRKAIYALKKNWTIFLLMGIALASAIWTFIPGQTLIRSIALVGTSLFGLYLAIRYTIQDQLRLLGWSFLVIIIMSFLFAIFIPTYGIMSSGIHSGAWRGIYVHKNVMGKIMVIGAVVFWLLATNPKEKSWLVWVDWLGLGLSFCLIILSKSSSSMINLITIFTLIPIYHTLSWRYYLMIPTLITIIAIGGSLSLWFSTNAATLLDGIGKDTTLTGRADMWPYMIEMIEKHPWLGYGYNGFWNDWDAPGAYVWYAAKWKPPNGHNGLLDLWLELGLLGVLVFTIGFVQTLLRGLVWIRTNKSGENLWFLLYLTYLVLANLGESSLLNRNDIFWLLYVTASFSLVMTVTKTMNNMPTQSSISN
jgi:exopolysaccharide production protein ExoQ